MWGGVCDVCAISGLNLIELALVLLDSWYFLLQMIH